MKVRSGFVSNSSSSSFICIGYLIDKDSTDKTREDFIRLLNSKETIEKYEDLWEVNYEAEIGVFDNTEDGAPPGKIMIGKRVDVDEDVEDSSSIDFTAVEKSLQPINSIKDLELGDLKVITGTYLC